MIFHLVVFATVFVTLGAAATWIIFVRMVGENLKTGEIKDELHR